MTPRSLERATQDRPSSLLRRRGPRIRFKFLVALGLAGFLVSGTHSLARPGSQVSKSSADSCSTKVKNLETFAADPDGQKKQTTQFTENEVNSYLALNLRENYHPSLKNLEFTFEEGSLQAVAIIDFDPLGFNSGNLFSKILAKILSGTHDLTIRGKLVSDAGEANFRLEEALFDAGALPNFLVEEIITSVGRKQTPPFDPMQPSRMPYRIEKVALHKGYIVVHQ